MEPDIVVQNFIPKQFPNEDAYASAVATGTSVQVVADTAFIGQFLPLLDFMGKPKDLPEYRQNVEKNKNKRVKSQTSWG